MTGQHATEPAQDDSGLWAQSEVLPDGRYGVGISYGPDRAWVLTPSAAVAYAVACHQEAARVEHDYAVYHLMTLTGAPRVDLVRLISDNLRAQRPPIRATAPLRFEPVLGVTYGPYLRMFLDDDHVGDVTPHDLRSHGGDVLTVLEVTTLDSALLRALVDAVGLGDERARTLIGALNEHWPRPTTQKPEGA